MCCVPSDATDRSVSASNPEATLQLQNQNGDDEGDNDNAEENDDECGDRELAISAKQQQSFQTRLEEGYDLPDPKMTLNPSSGVSST